MAQGAIKTRPAAGTVKAGRRQNVASVKKGARTIAPRKAALVKNGKITKVCGLLFSGLEEDVRWVLERESVGFGGSGWFRQEFWKQLHMGTRLMMAAEILIRSHGNDGTDVGC
jgi:hypothetical protein